MGDFQKPLEAVRKSEIEYQSQARDTRKESDVVQEAHAGVLIVVTFYQSWCLSDNPPAPLDKQKTNEMDSKPTQPGRAPATYVENRAKRSLDQGQRDQHDHQKQLEVLRKRVSEHQEQLRQVYDERDISRDELARAQKDIAALRDQVKLNDETEPSEAVSKFDQIYRKCLKSRKKHRTVSSFFEILSRLGGRDITIFK